MRKLEGHARYVARFFFPLFLEALLTILLGVVDSLMLARISEDAVGATGTASSYLGIFFLLFTVMSAGLLAVMSQYYGKGQKGVVYQSRHLALLINGSVGVVLSLFVGFGAQWILETFGVSKALEADATIYLRIVGACCILDALIPVCSCYLRAFGKARFTLFAALAANAINIALDAWFIFGLNMGVMGAAVATVIGKFVDLCLLFFLGVFSVRGRQYKDRISNQVIIKQILKIGLPAALESVGYSAAMAAVMAFLNRLDPSGFDANARACAAQITNFSYCVAFALAQANVIVCGWAIGEGKKKDCYRLTRNVALVAIGAGVFVELMLAIFAPWICRAYTEDQTLITAIRICLFIDIALEIGRATNLVVGQTLKSTGDTIFSMWTSLVATLLCVVGGTALFSVGLKMGVTGAYIALALDECVRGVIIVCRWKSGKWEKYLSIQNNCEPLPSENN